MTLYSPYSVSKLSVNEFFDTKCSKMSYSEVKIRIRIIELSDSEVQYLTRKFVVR
jgi:hypothetical protein